MTLHAAKGLEFPYVFLCGMEDGLFPSYSSINADNPQEEIEEERRMFYVAVTRAVTGLTITYSLKDGRKEIKPSRFISELNVN